ncbi:MAG TPA: hypothetical protein ENK43_06080 [Planctomycetes bacterium]|nr:hypothetical protein [Planctomycetota bacterium]
MTLMRTLLFLAVAVLPLSGQRPGCDPGHPHAAITLNGQVPLVGSADVNLAGATAVTVDVTTSLGSSEDLILILGTLGCATLPTPWGGALDLSSGAVIVDGVGLSTGTFLDYLGHTPFSLTAGISGANPPSSVLGAVQAIVTDPTQAPFPFRNSMAIRGTFGDIETVYVLGDDDFVLHTFTLAAPTEFCGATYSQLFVNSNGFITFAQGSTDFTETMPEFFGGWGIAPNPGVAVAWTDLNPGGIQSGATYAVRESANGVTVEFRDQIHWSSNEPAGTFFATFPAGNFSDVSVDLSGFLPATLATDDVIVGVTDGDPLVGIDTDLSNGMGTGIASNIGVYVSPVGGPDSVGETIPANTAPGFASVLFFELGASSANTCRWVLL